MREFAPVGPGSPEEAASKGAADPPLLRDYGWIAAVGMAVSLAVSASFDPAPLWREGSPLVWLAGVGVPVLGAGYWWSRMRVRAAAAALGRGDP